MSPEVKIFEQMDVNNCFPLKQIDEDHVSLFILPFLLLKQMNLLLLCKTNNKTTAFPMRKFVYEGICCIKMGWEWGSLGCFFFFVP